MFLFKPNFISRLSLRLCSLMQLRNNAMTYVLPRLSARSLDVSRQMTYQARFIKAPKRVHMLYIRVVLGKDGVKCIPPAKINAVVRLTVAGSGSRTTEFSGLLSMTLLCQGQHGLVYYSHISKAIQKQCHLEVLSQSYQSLAAFLESLNPHYATTTAALRVGLPKLELY